MHKSLAVYASALKCTPGQLRRHIRTGLVPAAKLVKGRHGRPGWVIDDTSPAAIEALRGKLEISRQNRPIFCEPAEIKRIQDDGKGGITVLREIYWREIYPPPANDDLSILFDLADRAALFMRGLTRHDLVNPPVYYPDKVHCVIWPPHERKVEAYLRTQARLLYAFFKPPTSFTHRRANRLADESLRTIDVMQAARQLSIYHKVYDLKIGYETLAKVLGMSKSSLYRTYGNLVRQALCAARKHAQSTTQLDRQNHGRDDHPDSELKTEEQKLDALRQGLYGNDGEGGEFQMASTVIDDLPFEDIYRAALALRKAGKPLERNTLRNYLRRRGSHYYSESDFDHAIRAAYAADPTSDELQATG